MKTVYLTALTLFIISCSNVSESNTSNNDNEKIVSSIENSNASEVTDMNTQDDLEEQHSINDETKEESNHSTKNNTSKLEPNKKEEIVTPNKEITDNKVVETPYETLQKEETIASINYLDKYDELLKKAVSKDGKVNYVLMKQNQEVLKAFLEDCEKNPPQQTWSKQKKLAYWINLYNSATIYLITQHYPVKSITEIKNGKPWDYIFIKSGDLVLSLNDIENKIVRPEFKDPRIHAALNCAAKSCPKLLNEAYRAEKLQEQLNNQTKLFINDSTRNDLSNPNDIKISKIFEWYADDFKSSGGVINFINKYANNKVETNAKITYLAYNWELNN